MNYPKLVKMHSAHLASPRNVDIHVHLTHNVPSLVRPSSKRKVLLPNPKNIFPSATSSVSPSPHHTPAQPAQLPPSTSTAPSQPPYVVTQNTGTTFTSSTRFPTPPVPVQNTVIVQQGGQSVYVQQQVRYLHVTYVLSFTLACVTSLVWTLMASHGIEVPSLIGEMSCDCRTLAVDT